MDEPLIITCQTCQTRLRVKSAAAVAGAILACPKCQSMVHVSLPDGQASRDQKPLEVAELSRAPNSAGMASSTTAGGDWQAPAAAWIWKLAIGAACLIAAIGIWVAVESGSTDGGSPAAQAAAGNIHPPNSDQAPSQSDTTPNPPADANAAPSGDGPSAAETGRSSESSQPPVLPDVAADRLTTESERPAHTPTGDDPYIPPVGVPEFDLGFSPAPADPSNVDNSTPPRKQLPSDLPHSTTQPPAIPTPPPPSSMIRLAITTVDADPGTAAPVDPQAALSLPLADIVAQEAPILTLVREIAQATGASITFTPAAYQALREASSDKASVQQSQTTAHAALKEALAAHELKVHQEGEHLLVVPEGNPGKTGLPQGEALPANFQRLVTFSFTEPTPLSDVLLQVEMASQLTLLVDWASLAERRLRPGSLVTASAVEQPLSEVLSVLLPQLDLAWRPISEDAAWITVR